MKYISHSTKASTCSPRIACLCQDLSLSLYIMGMIGSPLCRCGAEEKTSDHLLCECEALATLIHTFLGSFWHGYVLGGVHGKRKVATATSWRHSFRYWYVYGVTCIRLAWDIYMIRYFYHKIEIIRAFHNAVRIFDIGTIQWWLGP